MNRIRLILLTVVMTTMLVLSASAKVMRVTAYCEGDITASGETPYIGGCSRVAKHSYRVQIRTELKLPQGY